MTLVMLAILFALVSLSEKLYSENNTTYPKGMLQGLSVLITIKHKKIVFDIKLTLHKCQLLLLIQGNVV